MATPGEGGQLDFSLPPTHDHIPQGVAVPPNTLLYARTTAWKAAGYLYRSLCRDGLLRVMVDVYLRPGWGRWCQFGKLIRHPVWRMVTRRCPARFSQIARTGQTADSARIQPDFWALSWLFFAGQRDFFGQTLDRHANPRIMNCLSSVASSRLFGFDPYPPHPTFNGAITIGCWPPFQQPPFWRSSVGRTLVLFAGESQ